MELLIRREPNSDPIPAQRRRACIPCTTSKRRCDMSRPSCDRCLDKQISCQYSSSRLYARRCPDKSKTGGITDSSDPSLNSPFSALLESGDDDCEDNYDGGNCHRNAGNDDPPYSASWFLRVEHWVIHHSDIRPSPLPKVRSSAVQLYVRCVRQWLQQWIKCGHCPMIHRLLFAETGMPSCLQDAYAALAVYSIKNEQNEDTVMKHIEDKANALVEQNAPHQDLLLGTFVSTSPLTTVQHLARVLSLIIYQFIRLFDGNIRQRSQAEKNDELLKSWTSQLWSSVNIDVTVQNTFGGDYLVTQASDDATFKLWRIWILMENVRRIWKVSTYIRCIYYVVRDGTAECEGTIDITARRGLWDATSGPEWRQLLERKDPLFVVPSRAAWLFDSTTPKDIDVFGLATMNLLLDSDKIDSWVAKSTDRQLETLLLMA